MRLPPSTLISNCLPGSPSLGCTYARPTTLLSDGERTAEVTRPTISSPFKTRWHSSGQGSPSFANVKPTSLRVSGFLAWISAERPPTKNGLLLATEIGRAHV